MTNYCICPACGHELAVSTTSEIDTLKQLSSKPIPVEMSKEFNEYLEDRDNEMLSEWSARWQ